MDAEKQIRELIRTATIVACVLSRADQLALIELTGKPDFVAQATALTQAGFVFHGIVAIVSGKIETAPNDPLDVECMFNMGRAHRMFGCLAPAPMAAPPEDQGAEWLQALYNLKDDRGKTQEN